MNILNAKEFSSFVSVVA